MVPVEMDVPVVFAIDPRDFCAALAAAFYDHPSTRMKTVTVTGDAGKTTVAWILRSILEQHNLVTGLVSSVEDAIAADRLTVRGALWEAAEPDSTLTRESTAPFCAAPYQGKYEKPCTTPDPVAVCARRAASCSLSHKRRCNMLSDARPLVQAACALEAHGAQRSGVQCGGRVCADAAAAGGHGGSRSAGGVH